MVKRLCPYLCLPHYAHGTMEAIQIKGMACILSTGRGVIAILLQVECDKQQLQSVGHVSCHVTGKLQLSE